MTSVGIIGAGIFGLDLAVELARNNFDVTVFEKRCSILNGTTFQSLRRVHSGLHYPRDMETARQSAKGFDIFLEKYFSFINMDFPNFYALASTGSRTKTNEFRKFIKLLNFPYEELKDLDAYDFLSNKNFTSIYKVDEGILNLKLLRPFFERSIQALKINLKLNFLVDNLEYINNLSRWKVFYKSATETKLKRQIYFEHFDYIIDATHSMGRFSKSKAISEYQITHMLNINCTPSNFGLTILDGDFLTVLPSYDHDLPLMTVYAPSISVIKSHMGNTIPQSWESTQDLSDLYDVKRVNEALVNRLNFWIPNLSNVEPLSHVTGIRCIEANVRDTDQRRSLVSQCGIKYFKIISTKIDHCVLITSEVLQKLS